MVLQQAPFAGVEVVHERDQLGVIEAVIAEELPHLAPVLLLDMGVVVLPVGAGTGEGRSLRVAAEVAQQVGVEEFGAVVAIEVLQWKRQGGFDILDLGNDARRASCRSGPRCRPRRSVTSQGSQRREIWCLSTVAGFGATPSLGVVDPCRLEQAIQGAGRGGEEACAGFRVQPPPYSAS